MQVSLGESFVAGVSTAQKSLNFILQTLITAHGCGDGRAFRSVCMLIFVPVARLCVPRTKLVAGVIVECTR